MKAGRMIDSSFILLISSLAVPRRGLRPLVLNHRTAAGDVVWHRELETPGLGGRRETPRGRRSRDHSPPDRRLPVRRVSMIYAARRSASEKPAEYARSRSLNHAVAMCYGNWR